MVLESVRDVILHDMFVYLRCGEPIDFLYQEYSKNNIKLNRCPKCGGIADKYIEFELLLVLIDVILHRKPALRHLLYNRLDHASLTVSEILNSIINTNALFYSYFFE